METAYTNAYIFDNTIGHPYVVALLSCKHIILRQCLFFASPSWINSALRLYFLDEILHLTHLGHPKYFLSLDCITIDLVSFLYWDFLYQVSGQPALCIMNSMCSAPRQVQVMILRQVVSNPEKASYDYQALVPSFPDTARLFEYRKTFNVDGCYANIYGFIRALV